MYVAPVADATDENTEQEAPADEDSRPNE
jgi:hypothetical protein